MADEIQPKPQIEGQAESETDGVAVPQPVAETPETARPGAEKETQQVPLTTTPKTYTEKEVQEREAAITSKLQTETAHYQRMAAQMAMREQLGQIAKAEAEVDNKDRQDVDQGLITQQDADQRKVLRQQTVQLQQHIREQSQQGEMLGRVTMAYDMGVKYGVNPELLVKDPNIRTPMQMVQRASELAMTARDARLRSLTAKPETFDKGPGVGTEESTSEELLLKKRYPTMYKK
uniref:Uncharacterized protein n=1 Tax=viral metagenome TaxID=1070528 RepID=A0A6M3L5F0_9ZZZZ